MNQELKNRFLYGGLAGLLIVIIIFLLGPEVTLAVSIAAGLKGWHEYARMMNLQGKRWLYHPGFIFLFLLFTDSYIKRGFSFFWFFMAMCWGFLGIFIESLEKREATTPNLNPEQQVVPTFDAEVAWRSYCRYVIGIIYIFLTFGFIGLIAQKKTYGAQILFLGFILVSMGDVGAFFGGKQFGKRKLWPEVSPGKTLEGALCGWAASFFAALLMWGFLELGNYLSFMPRGIISIDKIILLGVFIPPFAQAGDFLESLMKRASGMKDSGGLLPGHGGILDRSDGLTFSLPLIYFYFITF